MSLEQYKNKLKELKKVRSDATKEWDKLISDLESCVTALEKIKNNSVPGGHDQNIAKEALANLQLGGGDVNKCPYCKTERGGNEWGEYGTNVDIYNAIKVKAYLELMVLEMKEELQAAREALKENQDFIQDVLSRVNEAIATDCPDCDYQCHGCIRNVDDSEYRKKLNKEAITRIDLFLKELGK